MGGFVSPDWSGRLGRVWAACAPAARILIVSTPVNIKYLTGFDGTAGLLVTAPERSWLLLDGRYERAARQAQREGRLAAVDVTPVPARFDQALGALIGTLGAGEVAFEAEQVTVATLAAWQRAAPAVEFVPAYRTIERLRLIKDAWEVAAIRRACAALSGVGRGLHEWVRADRTEREIARDIDQAMTTAGFSHPAFPTIVASGPNSAHAHARPTDRRLASGDLVVLDFGGVLDGYCGDLTRMAGVGRVGTEARALFEAVRAAQGAALAAVRAQAPVHEVDAAARDLLTARGLGEAFIHATGHGLGLDVHEAPRLAKRAAPSDASAPEEPPEFRHLAAGMVCTIEPGAYVDGLGGVRLEDDVLVTTHGCDVLTDVPSDLLLV
jgi:Xaa-Pro aminopeptidase